MTDELKPPPRLIDSDGDMSLRAMLDAGARETPSDDAFARMAANIGAIASGAGGSSGAGGATAAASKAGATKIIAAKTGSSIGLKILGGVLIGATLSGGSVAIWKSTRAPATSLASPTITLQASAPTTPLAPANDLPSTENLVAPALPPSSTPSSTASPALAKPSATHQDDSPDAEVALLDRAQDALRENPTRALTLTDEHRARFAKPMLAEEREVIAIEALEKLGRKADADKRAHAFSRAYPNSSHAPRLETVIGHAL